MGPRIALVLPLVAACSGTSTSPPTHPAPGNAAIPNPNPAPINRAATPVASEPGIRVTLADVGLEQSALDRTIDPCVDFYQFSCGGWLANNPIPPDRARWGRLHEVDDRNQVAIRALLEEAAKGIGADASTKKLGDYYAACMDEAAADRDGLAALKPLLDKVRITDAKGWLPALIALHEVGTWVVFEADTSVDREDAATYVLELDRGDLALERASYLDPSGRALLAAYQVHVAKLLALAGTPPAKVAAAAADVVAIETDIARVSASSVDRTDETASYPAVDPNLLAKQTRAIDWKAYWKALGVDPGTRIVVKAPRLFAGIAALRAKYRPAQWASYFTYRAVEQAALGLGAPFAEQERELAKLRTGIEQPPDRTRRCIAATEHALGELLGQQFAAKHLAGPAKATATALVDALTRAIGDELARVDWMGEATRQAALAKLAKTIRAIGAPDRSRTYDFEVKRDDFAGNQLRAAAFETRRRLSRWGKPVERGDWPTTALAIEPVYDRRTNGLALPAGGLQPPFFGPDRSIAANLGGAGVSVGRALTKGFDAGGGQVDADGNLRPWWTADDRARFAARAQCLATEYAGFEAMPNGFVDGKATLAENVADLGGVKLAFAAYRALRTDAAKVYVADGFTEDQQFFIAVGQAWCTQERPAELAKRLHTDPHAPPKFRVYGALRNLREFSAAFACAPGTPMNPAKTCTVW